MGDVGAIYLCVLTLEKEVGMDRVTRLYMRLYGEVQGVGFRGYVRRLAEAYGVSGYVRNMPDGSVELVAEGDENTVAAFREEVLRTWWGNIWDFEERWERGVERRYEGFHIAF